MLPSTPSTPPPSRRTLECPGAPTRPSRIPVHAANGATRQLDFSNVQDDDHDDNDPQEVSVRPPLLPSFYINLEDE